MAYAMAPQYAQAFPTAVQTAPVSAAYGTQPFYAAATPMIETMEQVSYPQYAMQTAPIVETFAAAPAIEYVQQPAIQYAAAPAIEYMAAPAVQYAAAPAIEYAAAPAAIQYAQPAIEYAAPQAVAAPYQFATVPAVQTFAQAPVYETMAAPIVETITAPQQFNFAAAPVQYAAAPAVEYAAPAMTMAPQFVETYAQAPIMETVAAPAMAPMTMSYAMPTAMAPSYTPAPVAMAPQAGSYYLPQSSSMVAYPGFQTAGPFNFTAGPQAVVVQQPTAVAAPAPVAVAEPTVVKPAEPKKKKVTKKTKKGCC